MAGRGFKQLLAEANAVVETVSVQDALPLLSEPGVTFVDVRETVERQQSGSIPTAVHAPRGFLEFHADPESPMHNPELAGGRLLLFCASGGRSALAAKTLIEMGITDVCHMAGGLAAWKEAGGAIED